MLYFAVEWVHDFPDEPIHLYQELNDQRYEQRKVYVFRDGTLQSADASHGLGSTFLAWEPTPTLQEIAEDPQFRVREITAHEFEDVWTHATDYRCALLSSLAERVNTGTSDPDTSRALVVFNLTEQNLTEQPQSGLAVFRAGMSWPADTPLPPVIIRELDGEIVASALTERQEGPDRKGRAERRHLTFALRFVVRDVPAQGWRTYIASYTSEAGPDAPEALADETPGLTVVETLRHTGDLPPAGQGLHS